jgi:hypothetical protein
MVAPPSQTYRQIGFSLQGAPTGPADFNFGIRPEELTVSEPSRLTVQSTLGGAWADTFGVGVSTITLSGHNGWRGGILSSGEDLFQQLQATCFTGWHQAREDAVSQGQDPDSVQLFFTDSLDDIAVLVAPESFTLRRSKTSPLLMRYSIKLVVLGPADGPVSAVDEIINALSNPLRWLSARLGLTQIIAQINQYVGIARAVFGAAATAITNFVNVGVQLFASIADIAGQLQGQFTGAILSIGIVYARAASTAFAVLADDSTLSDSEMLPMSQLSSAFYDAACSMSNGFNQIDAFPDYAAMRGASTCSSTGGGDPASVFTVQNVSALGYVVPSISPPPVEVTSDAAAAMAALSGQSDPLTMTDQQIAVADLMRRIGSGVSVA